MPDDRDYRYEDDDDRPRRRPRRDEDFDERPFRRDENIPDYLVPSILATLFCCVPFGIVAIVHAAKVKEKLRAGDFDEARRASDAAKMWCWIAFALGLLAVPLGCLAGILQAMAEQHQF